MWDLSIKVPFLFEACSLFRMMVCWNYVFSFSYCGLWYCVFRLQTMRRSIARLVQASVISDWIRPLRFGLIFFSSEVFICMWTWWTILFYAARSAVSYVYISMHFWIIESLDMCETYDSSFPYNAFSYLRLQLLEDLEWLLCYRQ